MEGRLKELGEYKIVLRGLNGDIDCGFIRQVLVFLWFVGQLMDEKLNL